MTDKSIKEQPSQPKATEVAAKQIYFSPEVGEVEADTSEEAARLVEAQKTSTNTKDTKVGDA